MPRLRRAAVALAVGVACAAGAADEPADGWRVDTRTTVGYRFVDVSGAKDKYREDYNLRPGPRLFDLDVDGNARNPEATRLDRFHLEVDTPGNEPVSRFRLTAADRTLYDFRADFTRSKYFYAVPQLFETPVPGDVRTDDLHDFAFVRTQGAVDLTLRPPNLPTLLLGYRLIEREGDAVSTVRIPAGDSFLVREPLDTVAHVGRLGTEFHLLDASVLAEEEYRRVDRLVRLGDVLDPAGVDPTDASTLASWRDRRSERLDIPSTTVRVRRAFGDRLEATADYFYSHADLAFGGARTRTGTDDTGAPATTAFAGRHGGATLDTQVGDLGATFRATDRVQVHATYRFNERSENGTFDELGTLGALTTATSDHVRLHTVTTDLEVDPRDDLSLDAGVRVAHRDAAFSTSAQHVGTDTVGAVGQLRWRPWSSTDLYARYENVQVDDPFTVPADPTRTPPLPAREIALTFTDRATTGLRVEPREWVSLAYQLTADSRENASFGARSRTFGNTASVSLVPRSGLTVFASYTRRDYDNRADILFAPFYTPTVSLQNGSEDVLVTQLRWDFRLAGQDWSCGGDFSLVDAKNLLRPRLESTGGSRTHYDLFRVDGGGFLALHHRWIEPALELRLVDYGERVLPRNDYRATIVAVKLTKRWSF